MASITSGLQAMLGLLGTGLALLVFLVASNPSAGGAVVGQELPGFWRTIGPWLPTGAATTLVRNTVYFGGNHLLQPLLVLAFYTLLGAVLVTVAGARRYSDVDRELSLGLGGAGAGA